MAAPNLTMLYFTTSKLSENIHVTPEGYLVCVGVPIGRTGDMEYAPGETPLEPGPDGKIIISRDAAELFRPECIASFEGKSFTIKHPKDWVGPDNWKELTRGLLQNVRRGDGETANDLLADLLVTDKQAIDLVKKGLREVSCGYEAEYIQTGIGRGVQKNIVGNHLALVEEGRAGQAYAIHDHKGEIKMKLADRIKAIFAKAQDEAIKIAEEGEKGKTGDAGASPTVANESYDGAAIMKKMDGIEAMLKGKKEGAADASTEPTAGQPAKVEAADALGEIKKGMDAINARLDKLEGKGADADPDADEEETGDEESDEEETDDDDFEESDMTGDSAAQLTSDEKSRIEIIAPGFKPKKGEKDIKGAALKAAYATTDGKKAIDRITGTDKAPDFGKPEVSGLILRAASEVLKRDRSSALGKTKTKDFNSVLDDHAEGSTVMTAEKLNEANAQHYGQAQKH